MNKINNELDLEYLKPPPEVFQIKHSDHYIKHGEGTKHVRKIYSNVVFDEYERNFLREFHKLLQNSNVNVPSNIEEKEFLIYCYNGQFNLENSLTNFKSHLEWMNNLIYHTLTDDILNILKKGVFYHYGVDKQFRPLIFISFPSDIKKYKVDDLLAAICILLNTIKKYMFVPGFVENWTVIMEASNLSFSSLSNIDVIKKIINIMATNFPCTLEKQFIINPPYFVKKAWSIIEKFVNPETAQKISFLSKKDFSKMHEFIDPNQLENKHGGNLPNLTIFWPPKLTPSQQNLSKFASAASTPTESKKNIQIFDKIKEEIIFEFTEDKDILPKEPSPRFFEEMDMISDNDLEKFKEEFFDFDDDKIFYYLPECLSFKLKE